MGSPVAEAGLVCASTLSARAATVAPTAACLRNSRRVVVSMTSPFIVDLKSSPTVFAFVRFLCREPTRGGNLHRVAPGVEGSKGPSQNW